MEKHGLLSDERLEGISAIRRVIDPQMSRRTFYRKWRRRIDPIIMEYPYWWRRDPPVRYFTFRRLLYHVMLKEYEPRYITEARVRLSQNSRE